MMTPGFTVQSSGFRVQGCRRLLVLDSLHTRLTKVVSQASDKSLRRVCKHSQGSKLLLGDVTLIESNIELRLKLACRSLSNCKKLDKLLCTAALKPLADV